MVILVLLSLIITNNFYKILNKLKFSIYVLVV